MQRGVSSIMTLVWPLLSIQILTVVIGQFQAPNALGAVVSSSLNSVAAQPQREIVSGTVNWSTWELLAIGNELCKRFLDIFLSELEQQKRNECMRDEALKALRNNPSLKQRLVSRIGSLQNSTLELEINCDAGTLPTCIHADVLHPCFHPWGVNAMVVADIMNRFMCQNGRGRQRNYDFLQSMSSNPSCLRSMYQDTYGCMARKGAGLEELNSAEETCIRFEYMMYCAEKICPRPCGDVELFADLVTMEAKAIRARMKCSHVLGYESIPYCKTLTV